MRILFACYPQPSHYFPVVGLAWACRAAGHEVRVAGQPPIMGVVAASGIIGVPVGGRYDVEADGRKMIKANNELVRGLSVDPAKGEPIPPEVHRKILDNRIAPFVRAAEDVAEDLVGFARWWRPDVIISDPLVYAAPLAAHAVGVPLITHLWGIAEAWRAKLPGHGTSPEADPRAVWPADLVGLYARYDMKPQPSLALRTVDICPPSLQYPGIPDRIPLRFIPYNGSGEMPAWLLEAGSRPRICVTWGTSTSPVTGPEGFLVPRIVKALAPLDAEIVLALTAADRALLPDPLPGVRIVEQLPLNLLLPSCAALIHTGGGGNLLTGATYGVPQLMITQLPQQRAWARFMTATGAGLELRFEDATTDAVVAAAASLLTEDGPRLGAARLQEEMRTQPPAAHAIEVLEALAGT